MVLWGGGLNLTFLNNLTLKVENNTTVIFNASLTDDRDNPVFGQNISFFVNNAFTSIRSTEGYTDVLYLVNQVPGSCVHILFYDFDGSFIAIVITNGDGCVVFNYSGFSVGNFIYSVKFRDNGNYSASVANAVIVISRGSAVIGVFDVVGVFGSSVVLSAAVRNQEGVPVFGFSVLFYDFDGSFIAIVITNGDGCAVFNYSRFSVGNFIYSVKFEGNDEYESSVASGIFTVSKGISSVIVGGLSGVYCPDFTLSAVFVNQNGDPIVGIPVLFLDDSSMVISNVTTNSKGIAEYIFSPNYDLATYKYFVKFLGDDNYTDCSGNGTIVVNKLGSKLFAHSKR